jgi:CelD/BcsL family acetyltransferase involved in cellulose biosynthesis
MKITVIRGQDLDEACMTSWRRLQASDPDLASPYFCPEFTKAVAAVREDVRVGIIEEGGRVAGFFPFQRRRFGAGMPVGGKLSDFHGMICEPGFSWSAEELLAGCGLYSWNYHYLLAKQAPFSKAQTQQGGSYYIDVSKGFDAYAAQLEARGSKIMKDVAYKKRKLERDIGPVRFVPHAASPSVLSTLFEWKSKQYNDSGLINVFDFPWTRDLLSSICAMQGPTFAGMLSCLYAGDAIIAIHMGMRSQWAWNWWFPRHDSAYDAYSPGILLRILAAEHAAKLGLSRLDLGKGDETSYKPSLASGTIPVSMGAVQLPCLRSAVAGCLDRLERRARSSPLRAVLRIPGRLIVSMRSRSKYS